MVFFTTSFIYYFFIIFYSLSSSLSLSLLWSLNQDQPLSHRKNYNKYTTTIKINTITTHDLATCHQQLQIPTTTASSTHKQVTTTSRSTHLIVQPLWLQPNPTTVTKIHQEKPNNQKLQTNRWPTTIIRSTNHQIPTIPKIHRRQS